MRLKTQNSEPGYYKSQNLDFRFQYWIAESRISNKLLNVKLNIKYKIIDKRQ